MRPRDLTGRASLFIYLFIYSYFFPVSLLPATRRVKSSVQLSALYARNYDTSKRTLLRKSVCVPSPPHPTLSPPGRSICALLLSGLSKCIGRLYNCTQPTGMHARLYYYPTSDTVT